MKVQFLMLFSNSSMASGSGPREKQSPRQIILLTFSFDFIILIDSFMSLYPLEAKLLKKNKVPRSKIYLVPNGVNSFYEEKPKKTG